MLQRHIFPSELRTYNQSSQAIFNDYQTLEVNLDATQDDIKKAYKKLALAHHTDKKGDAEIFKQIKNSADRLQLLQDYGLTHTDLYKSLQTLQGQSHTQEPTLSA